MNMENKKFDPGWNDPPMLNYSATNLPPKSRIRNKRVAFPFSGSASGSAQTQTLPASAPLKLPPSTAQTMPLAGISVLLPGPETNLSSDELLKKLEENLDMLLLRNDSQISKEAVELLYKYWSEHKFSVQCQSHIYLLSNHLVANNIEGAKSVKGYLLTDFKDECKDWLEGIII